MILIALGANLPTDDYGAPQRTLEEALRRLDARGAHISSRSSWYSSIAWPNPNDPPFVNGVAHLTTNLDPENLLSLMHTIEAELGRTRSSLNSPRTCDLDLLVYKNLVREDALRPPILPHPRIAQRNFVLEPLAELAPHWRHPLLDQTAKELLNDLYARQEVPPKLELLIEKDR